MSIKRCDQVEINNLGLKSLSKCIIHYYVLEHTRLVFFVFIELKLANWIYNIIIPVIFNTRGMLGDDQMSDR